MRRNRVLAVFLFVLLMVGCRALLADTVGLTWEDDFFVGRDYHYTNGLGLFWARQGLDDFRGTSGVWPLRWATGPLGFSGARYRFRAVSQALWQTMQTPKDLSRVPPDPRDLPYAGVLAWVGTLYAAGDHTADRASLLLGLVGPYSGASATQRLVHHLVNTDMPRGWGDQLHNEPVVNIDVGRRWRVWQGGSASLGVDLLPGVEAKAGLLQSGLSSSVLIRIGRRLAASFPGADLVASRSAWLHEGNATDYWYFYLGVAGHFTANDLLVQGNNFSSSPGLKLRHWGFSRALGLVWGRGPLTVAFSLVDRSPRSDSLSDGVRFGSLSGAWRY